MARRGKTSKAQRDRRSFCSEQAQAALRLAALVALQHSAAYKRDYEPLSVPCGLNEKIKRAVFGVLCVFLESVAAGSTAGASANPLRKASPDWEGAFVAINHRDELGYVCEPFLFGAAMACLWRVDPPPVDEYLRHKGSVSTPHRDYYEALWLWDETSGTYCEVHALIGAGS